MVNFFIEQKKHTAKYYLETLGNGLELEMVLIPEGEFMMGAPATELESSDPERPQHKVNVPTFFMGKYPITQEQWREIMSNSPSEFKGDKRPVERVSWEDAKKFCDRLSQNTGREYRLPSEAEWEHAARAKTKTPFHYGETITTELANYNGKYVYGPGVKGKYRVGTTEIDKFPANQFGLCDVHGNVWEWCEDDWCKNYEGAPTNGSAWLLENNIIKVKRGGSWDDSSSSCRSAYRDFNYCSIRTINIGFRVVCDLPRTLSE